MAFCKSPVTIRFMRVELIFFLIGTIIFVGFIARILFERTRIPVVLILMGIG